jgi:hypothetical protein
VIELVLSKILPYLGGTTSEIASRGREVAEEIIKSRSDMNFNQDDLERDISELITKLYHIAEKIQENTKKMIVDGEFLAQEDVAEMVLTLSSEKAAFEWRVVLMIGILHSQASDLFFGNRFRPSLGTVLIAKHQ